MKNLRYPAVFYPDGGGVSVFFPDLEGCLTCGDNPEHAYEMAKEAMELWIDVTLDKKKLPVATSIEKVLSDLKAGVYDNEITTHDDRSLVLLVEGDDKYLRKQLNRAVRINTSVPAWMKLEAEKKGINISYILQKALEKELETSNL